VFGFKCKAKAKTIKKLKKIVYNMQDIDIKYIYVDVVMTDGQKIAVKIYGTFSQWLDPSRYADQSDNCGPLNIATALQTAQFFISDLSGERTFLNDNRNPTRSVVGRAASATIDVASETSFIEPQQVGSLVEKEVEI
jgi:hypothetical protein